MKTLPIQLILNHRWCQFQKLISFLCSTFLISGCCLAGLTVLQQSGTRCWIQTTKLLGRCREQQWNYANLIMRRINWQYLLFSSLQCSWHSRQEIQVSSLYTSRLKLTHRLPHVSTIPNRTCKNIIKTQNKYSQLFIKQGQSKHSNATTRFGYTITTPSNYLLFRYQITQLNSKLKQEFCL